MSTSTIETLNVVHQVLRGFALSFAIAHKTDPHRFAQLLESFAATHGLDPLARESLMDLASAFYALAPKKAQMS